MRHKALPLPGQLALDFDATEAEPGVVAVRQQAPTDLDRTLGRPDGVRMSSPLSGLADEECDALP